MRLYRLRKAWSQAVFRHQVRAVFASPPIEPSGDEPVIVTQTCHSDIAMYLVAIKSFYHRLGRGRIVILNDGSLTAADQDLLRHHVRPSEVIPIESSRGPGLPVGGTWERLTFIARSVADAYTIQLDADTVTVGPIPEVDDCVRTGTAYALGEWPGQQIDSVQEASRIVAHSNSTHVQILAEQQLVQLERAEHLKYVRGCSGFAGFPRGSFDVGTLKGLSDQMYRLLGPKWEEWGSEQFSSNFVVANAPRARVLPNPNYYTFQGKPESAAFIHFVGGHRFESGLYVRSAREALTALGGPAIRH